MILKTNKCSHADLQLDINIENIYFGGQFNIKILRFCVAANASNFHQRQIVARKQLAHM